MTGKEHSKTLGILFLVNCGLQALGIIAGVIMMFFVFGIAATQARGEEAAILGFVGVIIAIALLVSLLLVVPSAIAGYRLTKMKADARTWAIVASIIALLNFPLGTVLGVYGLWFIFGDEGRAYFDGTTHYGYTPPPPPNSWQ